MQVSIWLGRFCSSVLASCADSVRACPAVPAATLLRRVHLSGTAASADWLLPLCRFAGLAALDLYIGQGLWPPLPGAGWDGLAAGLGSLGSLRTLRTLRLRALAPPPQAAVDAVAALSQLSELEVWVDHAQQREPPCWLPLAQLGGLQRLCLAPAGRPWRGPGGQYDQETAPLVPAPGNFPRLRSLVLEGRAYGAPRLQVGERHHACGRHLLGLIRRARGPRCWWRPMTSRFSFCACWCRTPLPAHSAASALLGPTQPRPCLPCHAPQVPLACGTAVRVAGCRWEADGSGHLEVQGLSAGSVAQLEALTASLLPPGAPLRSLAVHYCTLALTALHTVSPRPGEHGALAGLTALQLYQCGVEAGGQGSTDCALAGLLTACGRGLRRLSARRCQLSELPAAPCLAGQPYHLWP